MRRGAARSAAVLALGLCLVVSSAACAASFDLMTTDPWLGSIGAFLGGTYLPVAPITPWQVDGKTEKHRWDGKTPLLALDVAQAKRFRLVGRDGRLLPHVSVLYDERPQTDGQPDEVFYLDPARLPYVAQKVMTVAASLQPKHYSFFQRRLAEFESRLNSTILSGRQQLSGRRFWELGGCLSVFWQALGCQVEKSGAEAKAEVQHWLSLPDSLRRKTSPPWKGATLIVDWTVSDSLARSLRGAPGVAFIDPPVGPQPLFALHDTFLKLGQERPCP